MSKMVEGEIRISVWPSVGQDGSVGQGGRSSWVARMRVAGLTYVREGSAMSRRDAIIDAYRESADALGDVASIGPSEVGG